MGGITLPKDVSNATNGKNSPMLDCSTRGSVFVATTSADMVGCQTTNATNHAIEPRYVWGYIYSTDLSAAEV